jgi:hypothetical protein
MRDSEGGFKGMPPLTKSHRSAFVGWARVSNSSDGKPPCSLIVVHDLSRHAARLTNGVSMQLSHRNIGRRCDSSDPRYFRCRRCGTTPQKTARTRRNLVSQDSKAGSSSLTAASAWGTPKENLGMRVRANQIVPQWREWLNRADYRLRRSMPCFAFCDRPAIASFRGRPSTVRPMGKLWKRPSVSCLVPRGEQFQSHL